MCRLVTLSEYGIIGPVTWYIITTSCGFFWPIICLREQLNQLVQQLTQAYGGQISNGGTLGFFHVVYICLFVFILFFDIEPALRQLSPIPNGLNQKTFRQHTHFYSPQSRGVFAGIGPGICQCCHTKGKHQRGSKSQGFHKISKATLGKAVILYFIISKIDHNVQNVPQCSLAVETSTGLRKATMMLQSNPKSKIHVILYQCFPSNCIYWSQTMYMKCAMAQVTRSRTDEARSLWRRSLWRMPIARQLCDLGEYDGTIKSRSIQHVTPSANVPCWRYNATDATILYDVSSM